MKTVHRILGEAVDPRVLKEPGLAYHYAKDVIKGRWPEGEPIISTSAFVSYMYAKYVLEARWPEVEFFIAKSTSSRRYLEVFPEARDEWIQRGWIDWLDT